ncbi:MAG: nuclear transport factor 2 family protein [Undibacterium sp.]|nr:nuclear transport factor 2 family protein [Opitutaceae bacterium]
MTPLLRSLTLLLALAVATAPLTRAQSAPPQNKPAPELTPREALVALVTRTLKTWEKTDAAPFLAAFADDVFFAYPGGHTGKAGLGELFADLHARKTDVKIYVGPFIVVGNEFVVRYQFACTDRKTGKRQAVGTGVRGTLRDGRIVKFKEYWDAHIPEEQMRGELPLDEGNADLPSPDKVMMTPKRIN